MNTNITEQLQMWAVDELRKIGYLPDQKDPLIHFFICRIRYPDDMPRTVHMSREILQQTLSAETQIALQNFKREVENGDPIFPYMSKSIEKSAFFDGLLFDWGFHHFHMGIGRDNDDPRFIKRSDFLLVARIQSDQIYFIKIVPHKNVEWYKDELVRIFADNWPDVAEAGRMKFVDGLTEKIDEKLRKKLRDDIHANSPVDLNDGRVYVGPNLGLISAGTPLIATLWAQKAHNNATIMQKLMEEKEASIIEAISVAV